MRSRQGILLTGATGLLGRYLLRDLLASGRRVGVLVRDGQQRTASDRLDELLATMKPWGSQAYSLHFCLRISLRNREDG